METVGLIRCGVGFLGAFWMLAAFWNYAYRRLTAGFALGWELLGALLAAGCCFPRFFEWAGPLSPAGVLLLLGLAAAGFWGIFRLCIAVSRLSMQNRELAIQLSLLFQEQERLSAGLKELYAAAGLTNEMEEGRGAKASVCNQYPGESGGGEGASGAFGAAEELPV